MEKKILYLHGLESSNVCDKVDFLKERCNVLAPAIDYRRDDIEAFLLDQINSFRPDLIIGSSMGGFAGLALANRFGIDCIAFNPAIHSRSFEPNFITLPYDDMRYGFNPVVILGLEDDVIDPAKTEDILEEVLDVCQFERIEGLGHRIPLNVFVDIYNKYVA
jgi:pimeloyl-ACP methyl ester carboxylesterase